MRSELFVFEKHKAKNYGNYLVEPPPLHARPQAPVTLKPDSSVKKKLLKKVEG